MLTFKAIFDLDIDFKFMFGGEVFLSKNVVVESSSSSTSIFFSFLDENLDVFFEFFVFDWGGFDFFDGFS